ncbi:MAG TPA: hypothetical protein VMU04_12545 [Candidatus Acidoferrum sp.]|nr:hypothetical protein [Candidatus Acidoferrum sp.]
MPPNLAHPERHSTENLKGEWHLLEPTLPLVLVVVLVLVLEIRQQTEDEHENEDDDESASAFGKRHSP